MCFPLGVVRGSLSLSCACAGAPGSSVLSNTTAPGFSETLCPPPPLANSLIRSFLPSPPNVYSGPSTVLGRGCNAGNRLYAGGQENRANEHRSPHAFDYGKRHEGDVVREEESGGSRRELTQPGPPPRAVLRAVATPYWPPPQKPTSLPSDPRPSLLQPRGRRPPVSRLREARPPGSHHHRGIEGILDWSEFEPSLQRHPRMPLWCQIPHILARLHVSHCGFMVQDRHGAPSVPLAQREPPHCY